VGEPPQIITIQKTHRKYVGAELAGAFMFWRVYIHDSRERVNLRGCLTIRAGCLSIRAGASRFAWASLTPTGWCGVNCCRMYVGAELAGEKDWRERMNSHGCFTFRAGKPHAYGLVRVNCYRRRVGAKLAGAFIFTFRVGKPHAYGHVYVHVLRRWSHVLRNALLQRWYCSLLFLYV